MLMHSHLVSKDAIEFLAVLVLVTLSYLACLYGISWIRSHSNCICVQCTILTTKFVSRTKLEGVCVCVCVCVCAVTL